jgi:hypothetical protein
VATTGGVTGKPRVQDAKADAVDGASSGGVPLMVEKQAGAGS